MLKYEFQQIYKNHGIAREHKKSSIPEGMEP